MRAIVPPESRSALTEAEPALPPARALVGACHLQGLVTGGAASAVYHARAPVAAMPLWGRASECSGW